LLDTGFQSACREALALAATNHQMDTIRMLKIENGSPDVFFGVVSKIALAKTDDQIDTLYLWVEHQWSQS
jgi:hypothetical protein